jgi:hypothetical protein
MDKVVKILKEDDLRESDSVYAQALIICKNTLDRRNFLTMETKGAASTFRRSARRTGDPDRSRCYPKQRSYCGSLCSFIFQNVHVEL